MSDNTAIIVVDHGSRSTVSNALLLEVARLYQETTDHAIVEPAHMDLAEPSIRTAFDRCVARGARLVVVLPFFLLPGRHWEQDIPALTAAAAGHHPGVPYLVAAPLAPHPLLARIMDERVAHCLACAHGEIDSCEVCRDRRECAFRGTLGPR